MPLSSLTHKAFILHLYLYCKQRMVPGYPAENFSKSVPHILTYYPSAGSLVIVPQIKLCEEVKWDKRKKKQPVLYCKQNLAIIRTHIITVSGIQCKTIWRSPPLAHVPLCICLGVASILRTYHHQPRPPLLPSQWSPESMLAPHSGHDPANHPPALCSAAWMSEHSPNVSYMSEQM